MKHLLAVLVAMLLPGMAAGQSASKAPASPDLDRDLLVGTWVLVGTARDSPRGFTDSGTTWLYVATLDGGTMTETGSMTSAKGIVTTWRTVYVHSPDRRTVSGTEESEKDGVKWTSITVMGTRANRPEGGT